MVFHDHIYLIKREVDRNKPVLYFFFLDYFPKIVFFWITACTDKSLVLRTYNLRC